MAIELRIDGYFEMTVLDYHTGKEMPQDIQLGVLDNLQQGEYLIGMGTQTIMDINDLSKPIYRFTLEPQDSTEYEFDEI